MFDAYKRFFRFSGTEKSTWYKGMAFELLRSIFEALQFVALLIVLRALVEQNITGATAWTALGIMVVSVAGAAAGIWPTIAKDTLTTECAEKSVFTSVNA